MHGERVETVAIGELVPLECALVRSVLAKYRARLQAGDELDPPKVVSISTGGFLVMEGNHRVLAAKLEGRTHVQARITDSGPERSFHEREARHAEIRGRRGFEAISLVENDDERKLLTETEVEDNDSLDWLAEFNDTTPKS